jgi:hypothetical protein
MLSKERLDLLYLPGQFGKEEWEMQKEVSCQLSAISFQLSAFSFQLSAFNGELPQA